MYVLKSYCSFARKYIYDMNARFRLTIPLCDAFFSCCIPQGRWNQGTGQIMPTYYIAEPLLVTDFEK